MPWRYFNKKTITLNIGLFSFINKYILLIIYFFINSHWHLTLKLDAPASWVSSSDYIYIYIYIRKMDNKVIQVEGEIYWEAKSTLQCFGSNEPPSGLWGMILVMLNQWWMLKNTKYKNLGKICIARKNWSLN